ncbi:MAG: hypothetical protein OXL39_15415 [Caldilineaceae bacterium]|nr:hypothetical protein [Caldilineaceae bacterium]
MMPMNAQFQLLEDGLGAGAPPAGWAAIVDLPVLVLVGVTGVGKSTAVNALRSGCDGVSLLPNRRKIADLLVIPTVQGWDGETPGAVTDRRLRFDYTRRYRERYSGGLAHALSRLVLPRPQAGAPGLHIFDGLRGADEVTFAAQSLPLARFAVLHAPDVVRVERLLQRRDAFDQVAGLEAGGGFRWEDAAEGRALFTQEEQDRLAALVRRGEVDGVELAAKVAIVAAERRNYDPHAAAEILRREAPDRTVVVDTTTHSPAEAAAAIGELIHAAAGSQ